MNKAVLDRADVFMAARGPRELEQATAELLGAELHRVLREEREGMYGLTSIGSPVLQSIARRALDRAKKALWGAAAMRQQPDWLGQLARITATGAVWQMRDAYGARIALIAGFSYPEGVDRSVFLFDIDACGVVEIVHAGVFDDVPQAATAWRALVGDTAQSAPPERVETAERLRCLVHCDSGDILRGTESRTVLDNWFRARRRIHDLAEALRRRQMSLPAARSLYRDLDTDPMAEAFTGWHVQRHGTEPDPEAVGALAQKWMEGTLPDTWHAISPHRVEFQLALINDWIPDDPITIAAKALLPEWVRWHGEQAIGDQLLWSCVINGRTGLLSSVCLLLPSVVPMSPLWPTEIYGEPTNQRGTSAMIEQEPPRTRLEQLLRQRHVTLEEFRKNYQRAAKTELSERQAYRWVAGELSGLPYPAARGTLEEMFGEPVARLFGPPYGIEMLRPVRCRNGAAHGRGTARTDWEGQVIAISADRARDFLSRIEVSNVGAETLDQLADDVRRLVVAYLQQPLPTLLSDLVDTQDRAFTLLEGHQRPEQTRDLYLAAGITCGLMAMTSQDLGAPHDAMTHARTGYACADNAGHDGLRAWTRALQANITYWSGRWEDSLRYARLGTEAAARSRGTAGVLLASSEARALAALNRLDEVHVAVAWAAEARDRVQPDELDILGGICNFSRPPQLYYAAEALSWGGAPEANHAEQFALEALNTYAAAPQGSSIRNEANTRSALAVARVARREVDGATEALVPVLALPPAQRTHTIVTSVGRVHTALQTLQDPGRNAIELASAIEAFTSERLTRAR